MWSRPGREFFLQIEEILTQRRFQGHEVLTMGTKELESRSVLSTMEAASHMGPSM